MTPEARRGLAALLLLSAFIFGPLGILAAVVPDFGWTLVALYVAVFVAAAIGRAQAVRQARTARAAAPSVRPDFVRLAEQAERDGLLLSAAMYRDMDVAWPNEGHQPVRPDPGRMYEPVPSIDREDVELLHGVPVYLDLSSTGRRRRARYDREEKHPLARRCICHHAVWHSCPDKAVGLRVMSSLPSRGTKVAAR